MNRYRIKNKIPIIIACIQWYFSTIFQVESLYFTYTPDSSMYLLVKALYFILLLIMWSFIFNVYNKIKENDENYKRGFDIFCIYLTIILLLLIVMWPGTWSWDDAGILIANKEYQWTAWQHIITGIYQDVLLQILPFPGGIILLQNIGISLSVAFFIVKLENSFNILRLKNKYLDILIKLLPFLTPPVLMYQFSGYRIGVYVYIELAMLIIWLCSIKDKEEWKWEYILLFCVLCAITASWRTESLFYIPFICISILLMQNKVLPSVKKMICTSMIISAFLCINQVQNTKLVDNSYKLVSILRPCTELVRIADPEEDKLLLDELSHALNLEIIYSNPEKNGEELFWSYGVVKAQHTKEGYNKCIKAFFKLCLKYPAVVLHERFAMFIQASGITGASANNYMFSYSFYDDDNGNIAATEVKNANWIANKPIFPQLRKKLISALNIRTEHHISVLNKVVWNSIIPMIFLLIIWLKVIQFRRWHVCIIFTAIIIRLPVVFLTQPAGWFMYFLSPYFLGYVTLVYGILFYKGMNRINK